MEYTNTINTLHSNLSTAADTIARHNSPTFTEYKDIGKQRRKIISRECHITVTGHHDNSYTLSAVQVVGEDSSMLTAYGAFVELCEIAPTLQMQHSISDALEYSGFGMEYASTVRDIVTSLHSTVSDDIFYAATAKTHNPHIVLFMKVGETLIYAKIKK